MPSRTPIDAQTRRSAVFSSLDPRPLSCDSDSGLQMGASPFSVAYWFRHAESVPSGQRVFFGKGDEYVDLDLEWYVGESVGETLIFLFSEDGGSSGGTQIFPSIPLVVGSWYYHASSYAPDGSFVSYLIHPDGTVDTDGPYATGGADIFEGDAAFTVGGNSFAENDPTVRLSEIAIWKDRVLTQAEFVTLWASGRGTPYEELTTAQATSLLSFWSLNEKDGLRFDRVGGRTLSYPTGKPVAVALGPGDRGIPTSRSTGERAAHFKALESLGSTNAAFQAGTGSFTLCGWVWFEGDTVQDFLGKYNTTGSRNYLLQRASATRQIHFFVSAAGDGTVTTNVASAAHGPLEVCRWHFVVAWYDHAASKIHIQVNNGPIDETAFTGPIFSDSTAFRIGRSVGTSVNLLGKASRVGLWRVVLTQAQRTALWNDGAGLDYASLPSSVPTPHEYVNLNENVGSRISSVNAITFGESAFPIHSDGGVTGEQPAAMRGVRGAFLQRHKSQKLEIDDNAALSLAPSQAFAAGGWFRLDTTPCTPVSEFMGIAMKGDGGNNTTEWQVFVNSSRALSFRVGDGVASLALTNRSIDLGRWYHVLITYDPTAVGAEFRVYLNGVLSSTQAAGAVATGSYDSSFPLRFGALATASHHLNGALSRWGFWKRAHSQADVTALYNSGRGQSYRDLSAAQALSLAAYWNMDEQSGTRYDSHSTNHLTETGGPITAVSVVLSSDGFQRPKSAGAATFRSALSQYLTTPDTDALSMGAGRRLSVGGWFKSGQRQLSSRHLITKWDTATGGNREWRLYHVNTNSYRLQVSADGTTLSQAVDAAVYGNPDVGQWAFIVATYDGTNIAIRVNNGVASTAAYSSDMIDGTHPVRFGSNANTNDFWDGDMSHCFLYQKALSDAEQTALFNQGTPVPYAALSTAQKVSLSGYWDMGELGGTRDDAHSTHDLTPVGSGGPVAAQGVAGRLWVPRIIGTRSAKTPGSNTNYLLRADSGAADPLRHGDIDLFWGGWIYFAGGQSLVGNRTFLVKGGAAGTREFALQAGTTNLLTVLAYSAADGSTLASFTHSRVLEAGRWHYIGVYHDSVNNLIGISVDGSEFVTAAHAAGLFAGTGPFNVGAFASAAQGFLGLLARWGRWNRIPTASEVRTLMRNGRGALYADLSAAEKVSLVEYWDLSEASGSRVGAHAGLILAEQGGAIATGMGPGGEG